MRLKEREREREEKKRNLRMMTKRNFKAMIDNENFFSSMKDYFSYLRDLESVFLGCENLAR
jgi:hypothetical protein